MGDGLSPETIPHEVTITKGFFISSTLITQLQYFKIMGEINFNKLNENNFPAACSYHNAIKFCKSLSKQTKKLVTIPTEAQWEYSCKAGTITNFYFGNNNKDIYDYEWVWENSNRNMHGVGLKLPNNWGLYDMIGLIPEWCSDYYDPKYWEYPTEDPQVSYNKNKNITKKVVRGHSFLYNLYPHNNQCHRYSHRPTGLLWDIGFRIIINQE
jgi:formylglycine-generating enzyme required for sulfatase activity